MNGKMLVLSGRNGDLLWQIDLPEGKDSFYSPVVTRNNKNDYDKFVLQ